MCWRRLKPTSQIAAGLRCWEASWTCPDRKNVVSLGAEAQRACWNVSADTDRLCGQFQTTLRSLNTYSISLLSWGLWGRGLEVLKTRCLSSTTICLTFTVIQSVSIIMFGNCMIYSTQQTFSKGLLFARYCASWRDRTCLKEFNIRWGVKGGY